MAACRASPSPTSRRSASRVIRKRVQARTTSATCSTASSRRWKGARCRLDDTRPHLHAAPQLESLTVPKRTDIKSVLIIGAGPIVIGQACEFDYSGVQACKALREEGYKVILVN